MTTDSFETYPSDTASHQPWPGRRLSQNIVPVRRNADQENGNTRSNEENQNESAIVLLKQQLADSEQKLQSAQQNLLESQLKIQALGNSMSHDLRTPLRAIAGFSKFLKQDYEGKFDETADKYINHVVEGATRMEQLIEALVQYSRISSKTLPDKIFDLNVLLVDALSSLVDLTIYGDTVVVDGELPKVRGDGAQLTFLLQNLIENGLKFNRSESPKIRIQVQKVSKDWQISICDNGIGIAEEYLNSTFDLFRRLHLRSEFSGEGSGLSICRQIVEHHSGKLWLESEEGVGTKAVFSLPAL